MFCKLPDYKFLNKNYSSYGYRDLKPSNLLYASIHQTPESLKLCDLGFAKQLRADNGLLMTPCYTANFVAPEVLKRQGYDLACDIWSLGVILYIMLDGRAPFATTSNDSPEIILDRIVSGHIDFQSDGWKSITPEVIDLLRKMLHIAPQKRPTAAQLLAHPWLCLSPPIIQSTELSTSMNLNREASVALKGAVDATFRAISSPQAANVGPVAMSELARRRAKDRQL